MLKTTWHIISHIYIDYRNPFEPPVAIKKVLYMFCAICEKFFSRKWDLKNDMRIHTGEKPYQCEICERRFNVKNNMRTHYLSHLHWIQESRLTPNAIKGSLHVLRHLWEVFSRKWDLKNDMRIHTGEKPYQCEICERRLNVKNNMRTHYLSHLHW